VHIQRVLRSTPVWHNGQQLFLPVDGRMWCTSQSERDAPFVPMRKIQSEVPCREAVVPALAAGILVTRLIRIQCQIVPELTPYWRTCRGASRC
jgi:hypothetical protein